MLWFAGSSAKSPANPVTSPLLWPAEYEELGTVFVEAVAAGLPVVATRVGWHS